MKKVRFVFVLFAVALLAGCLTGCTIVPTQHSSKVTSKETIRWTDRDGRVSSQEVERETTATGTGGMGYGGGYGSAYIGIGNSMPNCRPYWGCVP